MNSTPSWVVFCGHETFFSDRVCDGCMAPNYLLDRIAEAEAARNAFEAQWGLDDQARERLVRLNHDTQQTVMSVFSQGNFSKAINYAFRQAVERIVDKPIRCTASRRVYEGDDEIEEFIRGWQLGNRSLPFLPIKGQRHLQRQMQRL